MNDDELWDEWDECDYCNTFGKTLGFHERDRGNPIHWDQSYIHGEGGTA